MISTLKNFLGLLTARSVSAQILCLFCVALTSCGHLTPKPLDAQYLSGHALSIEVALDDDPFFWPTEGGGLIGIFVNGPRRTKMSAFLGGRASTIRNLLKEHLERELGTVFSIAPNPTDLTLKADVTMWGWYLPTTLAAAQTGPFECYLSIGGHVVDVKKAGEEIAVVDLTMNNAVKVPLGPELDLIDQGKSDEAIASMCAKAARAIADYLKTPAIVATPQP